MPSRRLLAGRVVVLAATAALVACASTAVDDGPLATEEPALGDSAWARASALQSLGDSPGWRHQRFAQHRPTHYHATEHAGRAALHASSVAGNSTLRLPLAQPADPSLRLQFSWYVPQLNERADLRDADIDDAVVRVILTFDGDRSVFRPRDHFLSEIAHLVTGEPLPYATLMYVWDHRYPEGTVISNPHTERIRMIVVQSGDEGLNRWNDLDRDIAADFRRAFAEAPGRLTGLGLMSDSNNTGETVQAWFGPLSLSAQPTTAQADAQPLH